MVMASKSAFSLKKSDGTYHIYHSGYPAGGMLRFHCCLGLAAALLTVPLSVELNPLASQVSYAVVAVLLVYALAGYAIYLPFAAMSGRVSLTPAEENITFSKRLLGQDTGNSRQIPWEGKLETEVEHVGLKVKFLPFSFYRVKVVTDFMTYHVATFGPGLATAAEDLGKAVRKARYGKAKANPLEGIAPPKSVGY